MEIKDKNQNEAESYQIRKILESDLKKIIEIAEECNLSYWSFSDYRKDIERDNSICLLINRGNKELVGFIVARITASEEAEIYNIAIRKEFRRNGLGKLLINSVIAKATELDETKTFWLEVRESNQSSISFYKRNGFSTVGLRKNFYTNPLENAILMRLKRNTNQDKAD